MTPESEYQSQLEEYRHMTDAMLSDCDAVRTAEKGLFARLYRYVGETYARHLKEAEENLAKKVFPTESPEILTAIVEKEQLQSGALEGLYEMAQPQKRNATIGYLPASPDSPFLGVFFRGSYERFLERTDEDGRFRTIEGKVRLQKSATWEAVPCLLRRNSAFAAAEQFLFRLFRQYGMEDPVIFSPWARRFAEVIFPDADVHIQDIAEFQFSDPAVQADTVATTLTHTLAWNVEKHTDAYDLADGQYRAKKLDGTEAEKYRFPGLHGSGVRWKFDGCQPEDYILLRGMDEERAIIQREPGSILIFLDTDKNPVSFDRARIRKLDTAVTERLSVGAFRNFFRKTAFRRQRLRTVADMLYEINRFLENPYGVTVSLNPDRPILRETERDAQRITPYPDEYRYALKRYGVTRAHTLCLSRTLPYRLTFSVAPECPLWIAEDYARYVLDYLRGAYPEILWSGVMEGAL